MKKTLAAIGIGLLTLLTGTLIVSHNQSATEPTPTPTPTPRAGATYTPAQRLFKLTNDARVSRGIPPMRWDDFAASLARIHSRHMAHTNNLHHRGYYTWPLWGENVGVGKTVRGLFRAFMRSPDHRANMLNPKFTKSGVGVHNEGGTLWVTAIFFRP